MEEKRLTLRKCYDNIIRNLRMYMDIDAVFLPIIGCWVIGTYFHKAMQTYPYLYINATRGGGKTRLMKLLAFLCFKGTMNINPSESAMFRRAEQGFMFALDEMERLNRKGQTNLRLLLNAAYKKGMKVPRSKKNPQTETYYVEEFEVFNPIAMANIWGLDDVLQDRCITIRLDKSVRRDIVDKLELWEFDYANIETKQHLETMAQEFFAINSYEGVVSAVSLPVGNIGIGAAHLCSIYMSFPMFWNTLLNNINITTYTTHNNTTTTTQQTTLNYTTLIECLASDDNPVVEPTAELVEIGRKVWEAGISGRDLEMFLPLILVGHEIDEEVEDAIIESAKRITKQKQTEDISENRDVLFIMFLCGQDREAEWLKIREMSRQFKGLEDEKWINSKWLGRALKRLRVVKLRRRMRGGREVRLDWPKIDMKAHQLGIDIEEAKAMQIPDQKTIDEAVDDMEMDIPKALKKRGSK